MISPQCKQFDPEFSHKSFTIPSSEEKIFLHQKFTKLDSLNVTKSRRFFITFIFTSRITNTAKMKVKLMKIFPVFGNGARRNTRVETCDTVPRCSLVIDAFRVAVQMPLRKENRFRRSPLVVGWFCLVLEHAAGGCRRRLQERRNVKARGSSTSGIEGRSPGWSTPMRRTSFDSIRKLNRGIGQNRGNMI